MKKNNRRCISCRRIAPKEKLWRVVRVHSSQTVQLDQGMGRSAYICPSSNCLKAAQYKNRLGRALKAKVPPEIYEQLWERLKRHSSPSPTSASDSKR
ncbi:MAG: DUF448 domain-containing protein [Cyanobacteria bacterium SW_9_44_58]|nr:MAG: DUF448 domain-containing protein [Cyanobacteria bacterium SW_9_44_58]